MIPPRLRIAAPADLPRIRAIVAAAYTPWIAVIGQRPGPLEDDYAALVDRGRITLTGDPATALIVLIPQADHLLLDNVAVHPAAQGRGLGAALLDHAEAVANAAQLREIRLYTHQRMAANIVLYAARGYAETHRATQDGLARVFMTKRLYSAAS